nr:HD domain-containing protein [Bacillus licheniformis]
MKINDRLYGEADLEPVLTDLIRSKAVQRLKGIHQDGASFLVNPAWNISRCEHSIGVMLLIRRLGGSLEEQIAGLLHDVSHTAFSHVADDVFNMENEDYHEQMFRQWVKQSDISGILHTYGFHDEDILYDEQKWTPLEQTGSFIMCGSHRLHASRLFSLWIWRSGRDWTIFRNWIDRC